LPRKVRSLARRSAYNARAEAERVILVDRFEYEAPKTARLRDYLAGIDAGAKVLILTDGVNENLVLSARNLPTVEVRQFGQESVYDILWAGNVVIERSAFESAAAAEKAADKGEESEDA
jgi:large subunit ribosomal protein L4